MLSRFGKDRKGSAIEVFAVGAAVVAAAALFIGYSAQEIASEGGLPTIAFLSPDQYVAKKTKAPSFYTIDYTATGSIHDQKIIIDPCTGLQKTQ